MIKGYVRNIYIYYINVSVYITSNNNKILVDNVLHDVKCCAESKFGTLKLIGASYKKITEH